MVRRVRLGLGVALLSVGLGLAVPGSAVAFGPLSSFGSYGSGPGQFEPEGGIAIGPDSHTYVADYVNGRIDEFGPDGTFVRSFGELGEPEGIAVGPGGDWRGSTSSPRRARFCVPSVGACGADSLRFRPAPLSVRKG